MKHTVSELILPNNTQGLIVHIPGASVMTFDINFRAGEYLVERKKWETPHLMEHILLGANELFPKSRAFQAEFEKNGAYCNASTGVYDITYEAECADFEWQRILDLLVTAVMKPLFLEEEFKAECGNVREQLTARSNNHFRHLSLALREAYGFYAMTDQERLKLMKNVSLNDIKNHYEATHNTSNMRFVIAGNLPSYRRQLIKSVLADLDLPKGRGRKNLPTENVRHLEEPLHLINKTVKNFYFYFDTFLRRQLNDSELDCLGLINSMLTETFHSRIFGAAREQGLVYGMSSGLGQSANTTDWWFGAQVRETNAEALFEVIVTELKRVFEGRLTRGDIDNAKQYALGRYQRGAQTVAGIAGAYGGRYFFDDVVEDYYLVPQRIKAVTKEGIVQTTRNLFKDQTWGLGVLGSVTAQRVEKLHKQLEPLWNQT